MNQNKSRTQGYPQSFVDRVMAEKKKAAIAAFLLLMMGFMWVRVLTGNDPKSAEAAQMQQHLGSNVTEEKFDFFDLPIVEGRNDILGTDFFSTENWNDFLEKGARRKGGVSQLSVLSGNDQNALQAGKNLKLAAVLLGEKPQAFINDQLLGIGDSILVKNGSDEIRCRITGIKENSVNIKINDIEIELKVIEEVLQ